MSDRRQYPSGPVPVVAPVATPGQPFAPQPAPGAHAVPPQPLPQQAPLPPGTSRTGTMPPPPMNTGSFPASTSTPQVPQAPPPPVPPAPQSAPTLPPVAVITVQYPQEGTTLTSAKGSYVVRNVIGAGEFGAVYETMGPFDQIYAVKMMRPANRPYSEVQAEWAREVQRLMSLRHPNVVYIHDAFAQNHLFYLALERCDHPLKAMLGTPMQEGLVLELVRQLLSAVQFLHDNDVVHDDLHPGNVLITHASDRPVVKISDFGISHELRGMPAIRPNVVHHKIMAPEVLASGYTSKQSDLYQVGLLMYWMLTGEPAIQQDIPYEDLVRQVAEGAPRGKAELVGTPLGAIIAKMLRRRDAYRYTSAREVWGDLRELPAWQTRNLFPVK